MYLRPLVGSTSCQLGVSHSDECVLVYAKAQGRDKIVFSSFSFSFPFDSFSLTNLFLITIIVLISLRWKGIILNANEVECDRSKIYVSSKAGELNLHGYLVFGSKNPQLNLTFYINSTPSNPFHFILKINSL